MRWDIVGVVAWCALASAVFTRAAQLINSSSDHRVTYAVLLLALFVGGSIGIADIVSKRKRPS